MNIKKVVKWLWDFSAWFWGVLFGVILSLIICMLTPPIWDGGVSGAVSKFAFIASAEAAVVGSVMILFVVVKETFSAFKEHIRKWWDKRPWRDEGVEK